MACEGLEKLGSRAMVYLAAAVSDYYVPDQELVVIYMYNDSFERDMIRLYVATHAHVT